MKKLTFKEVWRELGKPENWSRNKKSTYDCLVHKDGYYIYADSPVHFWIGYDKYVYFGFFTHIIYQSRASSLLGKVIEKELQQESSDKTMLSIWDM